ncbi:4Fe-4S dicluster domain-containing protein [Pseudodesulfovibrio indicus]|uniref:Electron transport complex protein RnfC n=1 Tax=Pseudodesulfovibrio indicus TaxID=1716143 RepID=A0A126QSC7_9BACT|nr:4Fe-4S dicluster domain-containing protein [Pseudodesulfovibrio indicus]AMK12782.1 NADH dehydrogenase [Pseudodesulfovibrio indicus]TDT86729.1 electron transport complex protein RnfC [Pseudodesulfovibrio indicus]
MNTRETVSSAPAEMNLTRQCPLVVCGQAVVRGERIATGSVPGRGDVHAPFAGKVAHVDPYRIRIVPEGDGEVEPDFPAGLEGSELLAGLRALGADLPESARTETLIINGVDPEPGEGSRRALLTDHKETLRTGLDILAKGYGPERIVLAVPNGAVNRLPDMECVEISPQYPAGLDPLVAKAATGSEAPENTLVVGLETVFHAGRIAETGLPVLETMVTVEGQARLIPLGTAVGAVLEEAGVEIQDRDRIVLGGVLRGRTAASPAQGIDRGSAAVQLVRNPAPVAEDAACVGCGECVRRCPARLDPSMITSYAEFGLYDKAEAEAVDVCFECGLCGYFCIARRPMLQYIRLAKNELAKAKAGEDQ